jgi:hypothetical protein
VSMRSSDRSSSPPRLVGSASDIGTEWIGSGPGSLATSRQRPCSTLEAGHRAPLLWARGLLILLVQ